MRIIISLVLLAIIAGPVFSQEKVKKQMKRPVPVQVPSKEEMQTQLSDARKQARELAADLEKQIETAKTNEESPETIQELENQLATINKMMGTIDKTAKLSLEKPKKIPAVVDRIPAYKSPIIPIVLKQPVIKPTEAQAKDKLLWYKGKKIDPVTLVTTSGTVVRYSRSSNMVIVRPDPIKDTPMVKLVNNLSKTERRKVDFAKTEANIMNSFFMYPEILKAYEEFDFIQKRYNNIAKNTIDLPSTSGYPRRRYNDPNREMMAGAGPFYDPSMDEMELLWGLEDMHQELLNLLNNPPPLDFPDPPKRPNDLCQCDKDIREKYEVELSQWSEKFWGYEDKLLESFKRIHRFLADNSSVDPSAIASLGSDLQRAIELAIQRRDDKLNSLMNTYWNDVTREEVIVMAAIANEREKQKLGIADMNASVMQKVKRLLNSDFFEQYIDRQVMAKNYNVIFDYSLYLSHEYHIQLCEPTRDIWHTSYFKWQRWIEQYNRFSFEMDMDFELHIIGSDGEPVVKADGKLRINPLFVSIGRMGCKWQLFKTNTNYESGLEDEFRLPVIVKMNAKKSIKQKEIWTTLGYQGPDQMLMVFPSVRFSFCNGAGQDTLLLDVLRFSDAKLQGHYEVHSVKCDFANLYCVDILEYANKMIFGIMKGRDHAPELTELGFEMMDMGSRVQAQHPTGSSSLDGLQMEYSGNLEQHKKQQKLFDLSKLGGAVLLFDAVNGSPVLIDNFSDVRNKEIEIKMDLVRGTIHTKVVHNPKTLTPPRMIRY
jgi:hypothetical protein